MDKLNQVFNVDSNYVDSKCTVVASEVITKTGEVIVPHNDSIDENVDYDYHKTRNNLHTLLQQGQEALIAALEVAKASEHPRAFEAVGTLMKQLADINHQLLDLSEKRQKIVDKPDKNQQQTGTVVNNNAIFVGSTAELNKMIRKITGE
jgi:hypothetical protein